MRNTRNVAQKPERIAPALRSDPKNTSGFVRINVSILGCSLTIDYAGRHISALSLAMTAPILLGCRGHVKMLQGPPLPTNTGHKRGRGSTPPLLTSNPIPRGELALMPLSIHPRARGR